MRTIFVLCAAAVIMVGCTDSFAMQEFIDRYEAATDTVAVNDTISEEANTALFDKEAQPDSILVALYDAAFELFDSHKIFTGFEELLPADLLERLNEQCYPDIEDLVMAIHLWWLDDAAGEVIGEYSGNELFFEIVAQTKWAYLFDWDKWFN